METNCPKCQAPATNQSSYCFNCGEKLNQQLIKGTALEEKYKTILIVICFFIFFGTGFVLFVDIISEFFRLHFLRGLTRSINTLVMLGTVSMPLVLSIFLPKKTRFKKLFFIGGIILIALKVIAVPFFGEYGNYFF